MYSIFSRNVILNMEDGFSSKYAESHRANSLQVSFFAGEVRLVNYDYFGISNSEYTSSAVSHFARYFSSLNVTNLQTFCELIVKIDANSKIDAVTGSERLRDAFLHLFCQ